MGAGDRLFPVPRRPHERRQKARLWSQSATVIM